MSVGGRAGKARCFDLEEVQELSLALLICCLLFMPREIKWGILCRQFLFYKRTVFRDFHYKLWIECSSIWCHTLASEFHRRNERKIVNYIPLGMKPAHEPQTKMELKRHARNVICHTPNIL